MQNNKDTGPGVQAALWDAWVKKGQLNEQRLARKWRMLAGLALVVSGTVAVIYRLIANR